ncbi:MULTISPECIES: hypothetical protein [Streptomyces]|uniref:Cation/H+ exchanger domain-containing protein n=2 Tax=Streptomyces TaxID=1883 RepID=A0ABW6Z0U9_9ACTN|nr:MULTISPECIES: hypothetical protein [Streptomyces]MCL3996040.1 hypothetical protein [Streptomyces lavenduligriseus]QIS73281.1 hypothetical protein HB370_27570 [Streptomyces sp. DSM 40868]WDM15343.1 hypothetical protein J3S85_29855 [Streptomyces lavenduligriseus]
MIDLYPALWGLLGSSVAEALNLSALMRPTGPRSRWRWPWRTRADRPVMLVAIGLRLFAGFGLTAALGNSGQLPNATAAFAVGVTTPLVVAKFFQAIPITGAGTGQQPEPPLPTARQAGADAEEALSQPRGSSAAS